MLSVVLVVNFRVQLEERMCLCNVLHVVGVGQCAAVVKCGTAHKRRRKGMNERRGVRVVGGWK